MCGYCNARTLAAEGITPAPLDDKTKATLQKVYDDFAASPDAEAFRTNLLDRLRASMRP